MHIHRAGIPRVVDPPHSVQEALARQSDAAVEQQIVQQFKFHVRQRHVAPVRVHPVTFHVHAQAARGQLAGLLLPGAAQHRAHPAEQLHDPKRLNDVVIRPAVQALDLVHLLTPGRDHDDRHGPRAGVLLQTHKKLVAVLARKHHIQQDKLGEMSADSRPEGAALLKTAYLKARLLQRVTFQLADSRIVLYDVDH